ncbi:MAG TPA: hypothetical protein VKP04_08130 [Ktedonobacteraceae bacterium]|nr:hypothetical protein [Ktedonobacteraceae bacterium]
MVELLEAATTAPVSATDAARLLGVGASEGKTTDSSPIRKK